MAQGSMARNEGVGSGLFFKVERQQIADIGAMWALRQFREDVA
jgi:hypothetical protein